MVRPVILYRDADTPRAELEAMRRHFGALCYDSRMSIASGDFVVGRYSVLPFYMEQERDIRAAGAHLINNFYQHDFVADLRRWYSALDSGTALGSRITPKTWYSAEHVVADESYTGPYVVKGITNSKKHLWKTHMFAETKADAVKVMCRLQEDSLLHTQPIIFREYVSLKQLAIGINGMPVTKEFRFFFCLGELLTGGFYWSSHVADLAEVPDWHEVPLSFLGEVNDLICTHVPFYVVDVAQTAAGEWMVVELNDGQMSGPSECDLDALYGRLAEVLGGKVQEKGTP